MALKHTANHLRVMIMTVVGKSLMCVTLIFECHLDYTPPSLFLPLTQFSPFSSSAFLSFRLFLLVLCPCFFFPTASAILHLVLFLIPLLWPSKTPFSSLVVSTFLALFTAIHKLFQNILG